MARSNPNPPPTLFFFIFVGPKVMVETVFRWAKKPQVIFFIEIITNYGELVKKTFFNLNQ